MLKVVLKLTSRSTSIGIDRDNIRITSKLTVPVVVDISWGINKNCSVDSDDDSAEVSHYNWLPSVTSSQEYSYLEDQTTRSNGTLALKLLTV